MKWLYQDDDEWMFGEDLPEMDLFLAQIWLNFYVNEMGKTCGVKYKKKNRGFFGFGVGGFFQCTGTRKHGVE